MSIKNFMTKPYGEWTMIDGLKVMGVTYGVCGIVYLGYLWVINLKEKSEEKKLMEKKEEEN